MNRDHRGLECPIGQGTSVPMRHQSYPAHNPQVKRDDYDPTRPKPATPRVRLADLPVLTVFGWDGPPHAEPDPEPPPPPPPLPRPSAAERKRRCLDETTILAALGAANRAMSAGELRFLHLPRYRLTGPVREACERLVNEGRLIARDSPSSFTSNGRVRHYFLAPRPGPAAVPPPLGRVGPAEPRPRPRSERGRS